MFCIPSVVDDAHNVGGRLLQTEGQETAILCGPSVYVLVLGTVRSPCDAVGQQQQPMLSAA